jgi:hypothetical protein
MVGCYHGCDEGARSKLRGRNLAALDDRYLGSGVKGPATAADRLGAPQSVHAVRIDGARVPVPFELRPVPEPDRDMGRPPNRPPDRLDAGAFRRVLQRASKELPQKARNCLETSATITSGAPGSPLAAVARSQELGAKAASSGAISGSGPAGGARSAIRPMPSVTPFVVSGPTDAPSSVTMEAGTADCD